MSLKSVLVLSLLICQASCKTFYTAVPLNQKHPLILCAPPPPPNKRSHYALLSWAFFKSCCILNTITTCQALPNIPHITCSSITALVSMMHHQHHTKTMLSSSMCPSPSVPPYHATVLLPPSPDLTEVGVFGRYTLIKVKLWYFVPFFVKL